MFDGVSGVFAFPKHLTRPPNLWSNRWHFSATENESGERCDRKRVLYLPLTTSGRAPNFVVNALGVTF